MFDFYGFNHFGTRTVGSIPVARRWLFIGGMSIWCPYVCLNILNPRAPTTRHKYRILPHMNTLYMIKILRMLQTCDRIGGCSSVGYSPEKLVVPRSILP